MTVQAMKKLQMALNIKKKILNLILRIRKIWIKKYTQNITF